VQPASPARPGAPHWRCANHHPGPSRLGASQVSAASTPGRWSSGSARAVGGKATEAALPALATALDVPRGAITLVMGTSGRTKIVSTSPALIRRRFAAARCGRSHRLRSAWAARPGKRLHRTELAAALAKAAANHYSEGRLVVAARAVTRRRTSSAPRTWPSESRRDMSPWRPSRFARRAGCPQSRGWRQ
jgi:uncharacterized protein